MEMYISTNFKEFIRHKLNEEIKAIEKQIKDDENTTKPRKPDWISEMMAEFNEITKEL